MLVKLLKSDGCRRARVCELADSVEDLQQLSLDGFVICRRFSAADDIIVMAFSFLGKFLVVATVEGE